MHRQFSNFPHTLCVFWINKRFSFAIFLFCVTKERNAGQRKLPPLKGFCTFSRQLSRREGHINPVQSVSTVRIRIKKGQHLPPCCDFDSIYLRDPFRNAWQDSGNSLYLFFLRAMDPMGREGHWAIVRHGQLLGNLWCPLGPGRKDFAAKIDGGTKKITNIGDKHEIVRSRSNWPYINGQNLRLTRPKTRLDTNHRSGVKALICCLQVTFPLFNLTH